MKKNMAREQAKISTTKAKMQATIAGIHAQENKDEDMAKKVQAGVCLEDTNFRTISLNPNVLPLDESHDDKVARRKTHVFCSWIEDWEDKGVGPKGWPIIVQKILFDPDHVVVVMANPNKVPFQKKTGGNMFEHLKYWMDMMMD